MQIGERLQKRRQAINLTQQALADELNVTRQTVSRWENNSTYPGLDTLVILSDRLGISLDTLLKNPEGNDMILNITKKIHLSKRYRRILIAVIVVLACLGVLQYGRVAQVGWIDRINPFLKTEYGYAILPLQTDTRDEEITYYEHTKDGKKGKKITRTRKVPQPVDCEVFSDEFGQSEWLKFKVGMQDGKNQNYVVVKHRGSYVSRARIISKDDVPKLYLQSLSDKYHAYGSQNTMTRTPNATFYR